MLNLIFKIHFICILIYIQVKHRFSSIFDVSTKSNKKQKWTCAYTKRNINIQYFKIEQERVEITINCLFISCAVCLRNIPIEKVTRYGTRLCIGTLLDCFIIKIQNIETQILHDCVQIGILIFLKVQDEIL